MCLSSYHKTYNILCLIYIIYIIYNIIYNLHYDFSLFYRSTIGTSTIDGPIASLVQGRALGPNASLRKGPNDDLLL